MGPFCHANATHSPPRASLPPRPLPSSCALPSSGAATRCSILVPGGVPRDPLSPDRRGGISIHHDSGRENLANFDTKGAEGGKDKDREHARIIPVGMASVCGETERERERSLRRGCGQRVSPSVRHLTRAVLRRKKIQMCRSPSLNETRSIFFSVEGKARRGKPFGGRGNASRIRRRVADRSATC